MRVVLTGLSITSPWVDGEATNDPPANVERLVHVTPDRRRTFSPSERRTRNMTRAEMIRVGEREAAS